MLRSIVQSIPFRRLAGVLAVCWACPAATQDAPETRVTAGAIRQMQPLSDASGWALTDEALLLTRDGGASWTDVTSGRASGFADVTDAFLLDVSHAWLAAVDSGAPQQLVVWETLDGGSTWREKGIATSALDSGQTYARAELYFMDAAHGWLTGELATSSAFSVAELLRTTDGGTTWERLPRPPAAGRLVFVDTQRGFMTGAPVSDTLYRTVDGGRSWQELKLPDSAEGGPGLYGLPTFHSGHRGTLAVTVPGDAPRLLTFVTEDAGRHWQPVASLTLPAAEDTEPAPVVLDASGDVLAFASRGSLTFVSGTTQRTVSLAQDQTETALPGAEAISVRELAPFDEGSYWVLTAEGGCDETRCRQVTRLLSIDSSREDSEAVQELLVRAVELPRSPNEE